MPRVAVTSTTAIERPSTVNFHASRFGAGLLAIGLHHDAIFVGRQRPGTSIVNSPRRCRIARPYRQRPCPPRGGWRAAHRRRPTVALRGLADDRGLGDRLRRGRDIFPSAAEEATARRRCCRSHSRRRRPENRRPDESRARSDRGSCCCIPTRFKRRIVTRPGSRTRPRSAAATCRSIHATRLSSWASSGRASPSGGMSPSRSRSATVRQRAVIVDQHGPVLISVQGQLAFRSAPPWQR